MMLDNPAVPLRAHEQELTAIYENVPGIMFYIAVESNGEFRFLSVSRDFLVATGLTREQVVGSLVRDVIPPLSRDMVLNHYREAIRSGQPVRWEEESVYPAGRRYGEVAVTPLYDASGLATHLIGIVHDITERRRREERRAEDLLEAAPDAMVVVDQTGSIVLVNAQTERLFGYLREEIVGQPVEVLIPQRFHERYKAHRTSLFSEPRVQPTGAQLDLFGLRRDGTEFPVEIGLSPIQTSDGILVTSAIRDITERRLAEQQLATANERLHLAMESGSIGGWDYDVKTGKTVLFGMAHTQLGMSPHETSGSREDFWDHVHEDDRERYRCAIAAAREKKRHFDGEFRVVWRDGTIRWLRTRGRYHYAADGHPERLLGISVDISQRKKAEEELRASEERFRSVFREAGIGMVIVSPEGRFLAANRAFCNCLGYTEMELLERTVESITLPEDWPPFAQRLSEALGEGRGFQWVQKRCLHKSGRIVHTETSASLIRGREGSPQYFVAEVLDVTSRKEAEAALSAMAGKLIEAQEQERTRIARELHDDVSQQLALLAIELGQWDQSISHDTDFRKHIQHVKRRIAEIGRDVQELSHQLHSSKLEYLGLAAAAKDLSKEISEKNRIRVEFTEVGVPRTLPNEVSLALFRILQEALHNTVEHSGVEDVEVRLWEDSNQLHLTVKDLGRGFDPHSAIHGTGLGLTSMRERARLVGGNIVIESKPTTGTTIHVRVPLDSEVDSQREAV